jgi:flavin reductase ActVB
MREVDRPHQLDGAREELQPAFRDAMSELPSCLAAVTAAGPEQQPCGLLVSSLTSYSVAPPSLMFAVGRASRAHEALTSHTRFGVHILRADQDEVAQRFAQPGADKFVRERWAWDAGVPRLLDALIYIPCLRRATFPHGDHTIIVGQALAVVHEEGEPLIYLRRRMDWRPYEEAFDDQLVVATTASSRRESA